MSTLISVVIPSYNRSGTVGQTIESIINQKVNADIEIIIGDDCSTDDAREVLQKYKMSYPEIIRLIFHDKILVWEQIGLLVSKNVMVNTSVIVITMIIGTIQINCRYSLIIWSRILILMC